MALDLLKMAMIIRKETWPSLATYKVTNRRTLGSMVYLNQWPVDMIMLYDCMTLLGANYRVSHYCIAWSSVICTTSTIWYL